MQFRWVAAITLWTFIVGPALGPPPANRSPLQQQSRASTAQQRKSDRPMGGQVNSRSSPKVKDAVRS
jgi:hypothetical protein